MPRSKKNLNPDWPAKIRKLIEKELVGWKLISPDYTKVEIVEYERGWGQKVDETKDFDTFKEAKDFCDEYNASNPSGPPDWYMVARITNR
jgi:hypothetical protein